MEIRGGDREAVSVLSFQVNRTPSAEFSPFLPTPSPSLSTSHFTVHQSLIFLSESLVTENKLKSSFSKLIAFGHSWLDTEPELTLDWLPLPNTPYGWQFSAEAVWEGGSPMIACSGIWYQTTHYLWLNLTKNLCKCFCAENNEIVKTLKNTLIIKSSHHNHEIARSIL